MIDLIKIIAKRLKEQYGAKEVILFGSYAKGNPREDSDIDLLIISDSKERFFERQATVRRLLRDLKKRIPVSPIVLTPVEIEERKKHEDQFINEILETGIRTLVQHPYFSHCIHGWEQPPCGEDRPGLFQQI